MNHANDGINNGNGFNNEDAIEISDKILRIHSSVDRRALPQLAPRYLFCCIVFFLSRCVVSVVLCCVVLCCVCCVVLTGVPCCWLQGICCQTPAGSKVSLVKPHHFQNKHSQKANTDIKNVISKSPTVSVFKKIPNHIHCNALPQLFTG